jgi:hypothetical protein
MGETTPPHEPRRLRKLLCLLGHHRPQRVERVAGADELELLVCETCGHRHMRYKPERPDDDWGPMRR